MEVNDELIDKLSGLARLRFNAEEKECLKEDLGKMIGLIQKMDGLNTDNIEPLLHMSILPDIMREDILQQSLSNKDALLNAEQARAPYFIVPKVIIK